MTEAIAVDGNTVGGEATQDAVASNTETTLRILIDEPEAGAKGTWIRKSKFALDGTVSGRCEALGSA
jgi:hypothetical protein